jgi:peptidyl-prolyl cis-trans isomerase C
MMKFKTGCAVAVLSLLCVESSYGGALKKSFSKDGKIEKAEAEETQKEASPEQDNKSTSTTEKSAETSPPKEDATKDTAEAKTETPKTSEEKKREIEGDPVVARINGKKEIRRSEVLDNMKRLPPQMVQGIQADKLFAMVQTQLINTHLMVEQARKAGMDKTKEYREGLERFKEELLGRTFLMRELAPKAENESALKARYTKYLVDFKKGKECKLFHIMVNGEKEASDVLAALAKGEDFTKIAKEKSEAASKSKGGEEGYVPVELLPSPIKEKIETLKEGEYTKEAVKSENGYHIFRATNWRDTTPQKYDEAKQMLKQVILQEEMMKLFERLEKQAKVERFSEDGSPYVPSKDDAKAN